MSNIRPVLTEKQIEAALIDALKYAYGAKIYNVRGDVFASLKTFDDNFNPAQFDLFVTLIAAEMARALT